MAEEKPLILYVEDEVSAQILVRSFLHGMGCDVVIVSGGDEAVRVAQKCVPNLILLDISLPGGQDGLDVCATLKDLPETRHIPVLIITAHTMADKVERAKDSGAEGYLVKPLDFKKLRVEMEALLKRRPTSKP
jgi:CheY-like chemotaxis protein